MNFIFYIIRAPQMRTSNKSYARLKEMSNTSENFTFQTNGDRPLLATGNLNNITFQKKGTVVSKSQNSINELIVE
jgi:hypothetical protein